MLKRVLLGLLALILVLAVVLVGNTLRQGSRQVTVPPLAPLAVDKAAVAESLAVAVRARTVSGLLDPSGVAVEFDKLHAHLRARYPLVHSTLEREVVGDHSLLYAWRGSDQHAPGVALLAHQDVVPIAPGTESLWKKPPFDGVVEDGVVWGRGAIDNKSNLITQLEAVEALIKAGFKPRRSVYLVFGHDEEVGGRTGAAAVVALLKLRGVKLDFVVDEGSVVTEGILPGVAQPLALIGLAEKGGMSVKLTANTAPGHSSMPPAAGNGAIGMLSAALTRLDHTPVPGGIQGAAAEMFAVVGPELPFGQRLAMSNLWLLKPVVERTLSKSPASNAMLRTTTALTIFNAGNKENVLPGKAEAVVNFRILPGDSSQSVLSHVRRVVADERIEIQPLGEPAEPSKISSAQSDGYGLIERTIREVFPDALVAPSLVVVGTDSRHFQDLAENVYRFMPVRFKSDELSMLHGTNERISSDQLADMVRFYHRLLQQSAK
jgi:carboxypeptidase PM20D1